MNDSFSNNGGFLGLGAYPSFASKEDAKRRGERDAEMLAELERREADAYAARYLAEAHCPVDLVEWGKNHNIPTFAEFTWQAGFLAGWRMCAARGWDGIAKAKEAPTYTREES